MLLQHAKGGQHDIDPFTLYTIKKDVICIDAACELSSMCDST